MRKLALPEEVLLQIEQPARYIGNEFNSVVKDKEKVALSEYLDMKQECVKRAKRRMRNGK